jgi:hypothetical protein
VHTDAAITIEKEKENTTNGNKDDNSQKRDSGNRLSYSQEYRTAEDLALRKIEASFNKPVRRQAVVTAPDGHIRFDGTITQNDLVTGIEVLYIRDDHFISTEKINSLFFEMTRANSYLSFIGKKFNFIIVVVLDDENLEAGQSRKTFRDKALNKIAIKANAIDVNVDLQILTLADLKKEFGVA